jgi:hypothetical protein
MLMLSIRKAPPAISHDVNGEVWLRVVRETGQIVGFEFEDFERVFLRNHPELEPEWKRIRGELTLNSGEDETAAFVSKVLALVEHGLAGQSVQISARAPRSS